MSFCFNCFMKTLRKIHFYIVFFVAVCTSKQRRNGSEFGPYFFPQIPDKSFLMQRKTPSLRKFGNFKTIICFQGFSHLVGLVFQESTRMKFQLNSHTLMKCLFIRTSLFSQCGPLWLQLTLFCTEFLRITRHNLIYQKFTVFSMDWKIFSKA